MVSLHVCLEGETIAIIDYDHQTSAERRRMDGWVLVGGEWVFDTGAKRATGWMLPQGTWDYETIRQLIVDGQPGATIPYQPTPAGPPRQVDVTTGGYPWWQAITNQAQQTNQQLDHAWLQGLLEPPRPPDAQTLQQEYERRRQDDLLLQHQAPRLIARQQYDAMRQEGLDMGTQEVYERAFAQHTDQPPRPLDDDWVRWLRGER